MHKYRLLLLLIPLLSGCAEPSAEKMLRDYTQRVSNALEQPIEFEPGAADYPVLPPRRERRLETVELREGLIDVLRLRHCDLLPLIAERNSNLGRVMTPSQTLQYELRFLPAVHTCEQQLQDRINAEPELQPLLQRVREIRQHKEQQLPRVIWNGIYTSPEMEQQFSRSATTLPLQAPGIANQAQQLLDPFSVISRLATTEASWPDSAFILGLEQHYEQLYRTEIGSQWLRSVQLLSYTMNQVADGIEDRLARRPICFNQQPNNRATIIQNVFRSFYAQEFQPYLARVDQFGQRWRRLHAELQGPLPVPESTAHYFQHLFDTDWPGGLTQQFYLAQQRHTDAWQQLLQHCGLMPGSETGAPDAE
ncbi:MAG: DUF3080 family protein [Nitrincola lacisaponensis]|uniref:DUF3080 family protein n=1 Tax=Nitrincola lacisaponensis TaxID=267850 RepID=UPI00391920FF